MALTDPGRAETIANSIASHALSSQDVTLIVIVPLALAAAVVLTAIWAGSDRRKAALDVLDRIIRWRL